MIILLAYLPFVYFIRFKCCVNFVLWSASNRLQLVWVKYCVYQILSTCNWPPKMYDNKLNTFLNMIYLISFEFISLALLWWWSTWKSYIHCIVTTVMTERHVMEIWKCQGMRSDNGQNVTMQIFITSYLLHFTVFTY